ncbi:flagellar biosynthesis repressor FlbT [Methylobacterium segetis]|uniref:flagellar biosynthesis repressor FlbT n=1 Tax=Methylobacterium segetis TaxID=2488750 RepID=UPI00104A244C|nr:flagellar biosynthesis repressor FlbT [Methylobacterium segetis]
MSRAMHLSLRAGERVFINGAVLRVDRKVSIELLNEATFLLEGHVLQADDATTPLRQLYFAAQTMLMDPAHAGPARALYASLQDGILAATRDPVIHERLRAAQALVEAGRPFDVLKLLRALYPAEAALMPDGEGGALLASPALPPAPPVRRPKRPAGARKEV